MSSSLEAIINNTSDHKRFYAGIGSRETPREIMVMMGEFAHMMEVFYGWKLRSGGADGADKAFESGVKENSNKAIYLPWKLFNGNMSELYDITSAAYIIAEKHYHSINSWANAKVPIKNLMARNTQQVLGPGCVDPSLYSAFVICWTKDAATIQTSHETGGTGQAIRIANAYGIPVFNLANRVHYLRVKELLDRFFAE